MTSPSTQPQPIYRKDYKPTPFAIDQVVLTVDIFDDHTRVESLLQVRRQLPGNDDLVLDGEDLDTQLVAVDGQELAADAYTLEPSQLRIPGLGQAATLRTVVHLNPAANTELSGFYLSGETLCTQCEAEGFRRITWYLDRPDVLARFQVHLSADAQRYPVLLANGNLIAEEHLGEGRRRVTWEDPHPKPAYLFAMVAGRLDCVAKPFTTASGREVLCEIYVEPGMGERAHWALESLRNAMAWDEEHYGLEYDLDRYMIVAVSTFNMGAMENKGLNIFNDKYVLASDATATDSDFEGVEGVIAHEYFHNWTGNRVTCRDWFQLTLKEGLTVFRDQQFSADRTSHAVKRIDEVRLLTSYQFPEDAGPMAHPIRPESYVAMDNFYTATVYNKGAEVIRMYHTLLGSEGFRRGMDCYFQRHDGQAVTCDDFRAAMADANGRDLSQFERWYTQAGTPTLIVSDHYDPDQQRYTLTLRQELPTIKGLPDPQPLHIPVRLGLLASTDAAGDVSQGSPLALDCGDGQSPLERVVELTETQATWVFSGLPVRPVPSLLRDFSAPVRLRHAASEADLSLLARSDSDPFNRWQAGQALMRRILLEQIDAVVAGGDPQPSPALEALLAATLADQQIDGALAALALALPAEGELAQERQPVAVEAINRVRRFHLHHLATVHQVALFQRYESLAGVDPLDRSVLARQQRRLRHACLAYLGVLGGEWLALAGKHYDESGNMTERVAALSVLASHRDPRRDAAFADFYQRFSGDDLVIDKWFSLQATADCSDTLEQVMALREHADFRLNNPNRVRSLLSALAMANHPHFHRADGAGYAMIGDAVLALAGRNPQLAARLASTFNQWRRYDTQRQALMSAQLERIRATDPSRDVREIVERALA